jgi:hypothetical protein
LSLADAMRCLAFRVLIQSPIRCILHRGLTS